MFFMFLSAAKFNVIRHKGQHFSFLPPSFGLDTHNPAVLHQWKSQLSEVLLLGGNGLHFQSLQMKLLSRSLFGLVVDDLCIV